MLKHVPLTVLFQVDLVTLHPGGALGPPLRPDSAPVSPVLTDEDAEAGEVAVEARRVRAARSVGSGCAYVGSVGGKTTTTAHCNAHLMGVASGVFVMTSHKTFDCR